MEQGDHGRWNQDGVIVHSVLVERTISSRSTRIWVLSQPRRLPQRFGSSIGFKPGDFMTTGMNEKRTAWLCRVLNRVTHPG